VRPNRPRASLPDGQIEARTVDEWQPGPSKSAYLLLPVRPGTEARRTRRIDHPLSVPFICVSPGPGGLQRPWLLIWCLIAYAWMAGRDDNLVQLFDLRRWCQSLPACPLIVVLVGFPLVGLWEGEITDYYQRAAGND